ncbi:hypothetical protein Y032_0005g2639 [Ancylostoma ceylanicum]|uniref:Uncharacterized protein n=1 Tax=Ancylostoma ceylanicum TaxID=53326 RepID=A0A016VSW3_9BILA|nr:hypothetical protein Y032_0005g2639 [Ancylostoma ceylanicum]
MIASANCGPYAEVPNQSFVTGKHQVQDIITQCSFVDMLCKSARLTKFQEKLGRRHRSSPASSSFHRFYEQLFGPPGYLQLVRSSTQKQEPAKQQQLRQLAGTSWTTGFSRGYGAEVVLCNAFIFSTRKYLL